MTLPHGRGKQSFREFTKELNDTARDIITAIRGGEQYTQGDVFRFLDQVVNEYLAHLRNEGLDVETWGDRAVDYAYKKYEGIIERFVLPEGIEPSDEPEEEEPPEEEPEPDPDKESGKLFGHDIMTPDNKAYVRSKGKPRKRILDNLQDLHEYVSDVPYVLAIQILHNTNGQVIGYRVWVEAAKDKKKKRS